MARDPANALGVYLNIRDGIPEVTVIGELDIATGPKLDGLLSSVWQGDPFSVVVLMHMCTYCDSTGLSILLKHASRIPNFIVVAPPESFPRKVFAIAKVEERIGVVDSVTDAMRETEMLGV